MASRKGKGVKGKVVTNTKTWDESTMHNNTYK